MAPRRTPPGIVQADILDDQGNRCLYCGLEFGTPVWRRRGGVEPLGVHWDHRIPYAYLRDNPDQNWVAACHLCNAYKGSLIFLTLDDVRGYVLDHARRNHHDPMPLWDGGSWELAPVEPEPDPEPEATEPEPVDEIDDLFLVGDVDEDEADEDDWPTLNAAAARHAAERAARHAAALIDLCDPAGVDAWLAEHGGDDDPWLDPAGVDAWLAEHADQG